MTPVLCLCIHGRIPITVVEDNSVSSSEIDTNTTTTCRQDEDEDARIGIETLHKHLRGTSQSENSVINHSAVSGQMSLSIFATNDYQIQSKTQAKLLRLSMATIQ